MLRKQRVAEVRIVARQTSTSIRSRRIGLTLRKLREQQGLTLEQVAGLLECSPSKVSRIETGQSSAGLRDVRDLLEIYGVTGHSAEAVIEMAREARLRERERSWWHPYSNVLVSSYVGNEQSATRIRTYEHQNVPGLLQTEDYARAMFHTADACAQPNTITARLRVRMGRQAMLTRDDEPLQLDVVLDEAALWRPIGGDEAMRAQLRRLVEAAELPNVMIRMLPFEVGAHAGMEGTFAILDFAEAHGSSIVYIENATGGLFLDKGQELKLYEEIFERIQTKALDPAQTRRRITALADRPPWN
jgi:transcriptional regulator with XRE-family HTH domain